MDHFHTNNILLLLLIYTRAAYSALKACEGGGAAFPNATQGRVALNSGCKADCIRDNGDLMINNWTPLPVTETITAETIVTVINQKKGTTRTTTITNEEADLSGFTKPADINEEGYRTYEIVDVGTTVTVYVKSHDPAH